MSPSTRRVLPNLLQRIAAVAVVSLTAACGSREPEPGGTLDSATRAAIRAESITAAAVAAMPPSSLWDADQVAARLVRAGVSPRRSDSVPPPPDFLEGSTPAVFEAARGVEVRVFIFPDSIARRERTRRIDPLTSTPPGVESPWPSQPMLAISNNLVAVILGGSAVQRERIQLALEAGLPGM